MIKHAKPNNHSLYLVGAFIAIGSILYAIFRPTPLQIAMVGNPVEGMTGRAQTVTSGSACTASIASFTTGAGCGVNMVERVDTLCVDGRKSFESSPDGCIDPIAAYNRAKVYCGQSCRATPLPSVVPVPTKTPYPTSTAIPRPSMMPSPTPVSTLVPTPTPSLLPTSTPIPTPGCYVQPTFCLDSLIGRACPAKIVCPSPVPTSTPAPIASSSPSPVASACQAQLSSWTYRESCLNDPSSYRYLDFKCSSGAAVVTLGGPSSCKTEATWVSEARAICAKTSCLTSPVPTPVASSTMIPKPLPPTIEGCLPWKFFGWSYCRGRWIR